MLSEYPPATEETRVSPEAPIYFQRLYGGPSDPVPENLPEFVFDARGSFPGGLMIYGYQIRSRYAEDRPQEEFSWRERNTFLSVCFSEVEPDGELGFTPAPSATPLVREITKEQFEAAAAAGWLPSNITSERP